MSWSFPSEEEDSRYDQQRKPQKRRPGSESAKNLPENCQKFRTTELHREEVVGNNPSGKCGGLTVTSLNCLSKACVR